MESGTPSLMEQPFLLFFDPDDARALAAFTRLSGRLGMCRIRLKTESPFLPALQSRQERFI